MCVVRWPLKSTSVWINLRPVKCIWIVVCVLSFRHFGSKFHNRFFHKNHYRLVTVIINKCAQISECSSEHCWSLFVSITTSGSDFPWNSIASKNSVLFFWWYFCLNVFGFFICVDHFSYLFHDKMKWTNWFSDRNKNRPTQSFSYLITVRKTSHSILRVVVLFQLTKSTLCHYFWFFFRTNFTLSILNRSEPIWTNWQRLRR